MRNVYDDDSKDRGFLRISRSLSKIDTNVIVPICESPHDTYFCTYEIGESISFIPTNHNQESCAL